MGFSSKLIQRRVALAVKAFSICSSPVSTSSRSAVHLNGFALLSPQCTWKLQGVFSRRVVEERDLGGAVT